jgi:hypothetical protein
MNPYCQYVTLTGKKCNGVLYRQKSGYRGYLVCSNNKKHKYPISSVIMSKKEEM